MGGRVGGRVGGGRAMDIHGLIGQKKCMQGKLWEGGWEEGMSWTSTDRINACGVSYGRKGGG